MLGGSLAKVIGPLFGGILFSTNVSSITPPFESVFVYSVIAVLGLFLSVKVHLLPEYDNNNNDYNDANKKDADADNRHLHNKLPPGKIVEDNDDLETKNHRCENHKNGHGNEESPPTV